MNYYELSAVCHNSFVAFYVALRARTFRLAKTN